MTVALDFPGPVVINITGRGHGLRVDAITGMTSSQAQGFLDQNEQLVTDAQTAAQQSTASAADAAAAANLAQQAQAAAYNVPDTAMRDIIKNDVTETRLALAQSRPHVDAAVEHGVAGDGVTNDAAALVAAIAAASTERRALPLPRTYRTGTPFRPTAEHVIIDGQGTGELLIDADAGFRVTPARTSVGTTDAVAAGAYTITVPGATFTADEHVGKWVIVTDTTTNPLTGVGTTHSRRVVANTADTFTVDEQIGRAIPAGQAVEVATPIKSVTLRNLTIRRVLPGGGDLDISYADDVILDNVTSIDAGTMGAERGNAISIYHASRVRVTDTTVRNAGNFGVFVYHCDDVKLDRVTVDGSGGQFGIQLKDCTNGVVSRSLVKGAQDAAYNLKCSGLNESRDLSVVDSVALSPAVAGVELSSITNEGGILSGDRFTVVRLSVIGSGGSGLTTITDAGTSPATTATWKLVGCSVREAANVAYSVAADGVALESCDAVGCSFEAAYVSADDVRIVGGVFRDNCTAYTSGASRSAETRSDGARLSIVGVTYVRTPSASATIRAHQDGSSAVATLLRDTVIKDERGTYTRDYFLVAGSKAVGSHTLDVFASTPTIYKVDPTA